MRPPGVDRKGALESVGPVEQLFACGVDVPRPHSEDEVAGLGQAAQGSGDVVQGGTVDTAGNLLGQVPGGDAQGVDLPGGLNLRK